MKYGKTARLARLNVGDVIDSVKEVSSERLTLSVFHDPLDPDEKHPADPSHSLISDVPSDDDPFGETIGDAIAKCVLESFPANESL